LILVWGFDVADKAPPDRPPRSISSQNLPPGRFVIIRIRSLRKVGLLTSKKQASRVVL
jgi:hypothetical protein